MKVLESNFENYRYDSGINVGYRPILWYVLDIDAEGDEYGRGFSPQEEKEFVDYMAQNPKHFSGSKQHRNINDGEFIYGDILDAIPKRSGIPSTIVLRKSPNPLNDGNVYDWNDVILVGGLGDNHNYNLSFDVVGKFI